MQSTSMALTLFCLCVNRLPSRLLTVNRSLFSALSSVNRLVFPRAVVNRPLSSMTLINRLRCYTPVIRSSLPNQDHSLFSKNGL